MVDETRTLLSGCYNYYYKDYCCFLGRWRRHCWIWWKSGRFRWSEQQRWQWWIVRRRRQKTYSDRCLMISGQPRQLWRQQHMAANRWHCISQEQCVFDVCAVLFQASSAVGQWTDDVYVVFEGRWSVVFGSHNVPRIRILLLDYCPNRRWRRERRRSTVSFRSYRVEQS